MGGTWDPFDINVYVHGPKTVLIGQDLDVPIIVGIRDWNEQAPFHIKVVLKDPEEQSQTAGPSTAPRQYTLSDYLEGPDLYDNKRVPGNAFQYWFVFKRLRFLQPGTYSLEFEAWTDPECKQRRLGKARCRAPFVVVGGRLSATQKEMNKPDDSEQIYIDDVTNILKFYSEGKKS